MKSLVESTISSDLIDTSMYDITSKNLSPQISRKYIHEHTELGPKMAVMTCPNCLMGIESIVRYNETSLTHMAASCLFPLGLCAFPYCTPYFRDAEHYCPMCNVYIGTSFARGGKALRCCNIKIGEN